MVKIQKTALVALLAGSNIYSHAFSIVSNRPVKNVVGNKLYSTTEDNNSESTVDVSIPYNAAAKLAYEDWKKANPSSSGSFEEFEKNFYTASVLNVMGKNMAEDEDEESAGFSVTLNANADRSSASPATNGSSSTADIMNSAMESSMKQSEASAALDEAVDALAEEEAKLAEELGLESVEELEDALDAMAGISSEGIELEGADIAKEAKIRSEYMTWAKKFGRDQSEERFQIFSANFVQMEEYSASQGKAMELNQYADLTAEEYSELMNPTTEEEEVSEEETKTVEEEPVVAEEPVAETTDVVEEETSTVVEEEVQETEENDAKVNLSITITNIMHYSCYDTNVLFLCQILKG